MARLTPNFRLRPALSEDFPFIWRIHLKTAMGPDTVAERRMLERQFVPDRDRIVEVDGRPAGIFGVDDTRRMLYLRHIALIPDVQGCGLGTALLRSLLKRAENRGIPVELTVDKDNRRARHLYDRLGFKIALETDTRLRMRYTEVSR